MSVFTNASPSLPGQAEQYVAAVLGLLGDKEAVTVLRETPDELRQALESLSDEQARQPEAPGKWSVRDVLQHLADSELVWGYRIRLVLAQHRPTLTGYDQDLWAERLAYEEADPEEALATFRTLRRSNLTLVERATPADLERVGVHAERGEETFAHMIRLCAGHDLLHHRQIERIVSSRRSSRTSR